MNYLVKISFRNLVRQKRRNIMLGVAMAIGVMILVVATSFSNGITDIMFNKIISYVSGHVGIQFNEGSGKRVFIFRDKQWITDLIRQHVSGLEELDESIGQFMKALGNGRSDNIVLIGIDMSKTITQKQREEMAESFSLIKGKFEDLKRDDIENPVLLTREKARILNVKMGDIIRIRFRNVYGQNQAARLTVTGIISAENIFMQGMIFAELKDIKHILGYREHETSNLQIMLQDPERNAVMVADKLHSLLIPGPACIYGSVKSKHEINGVTLMPFWGTEESKNMIQDSFKLVRGDMKNVLKKNGLMISETIARQTGADIGSEITITFQPKFSSGKAHFNATVYGIFRSDASTGHATVYMHEALFYKYFYPNLPDLKITKDRAFVPNQNVSFKKALGTEWVLLERSRNSDESRKKMRRASRKKIKAVTLDVHSMYERASDVLKLQGVLNLITFIAVIVLFVIILIGVINTLRMSIRERTREIGTIRAIGMQKGDVKKVFLLETAFLTLFSSLVGVVLGFIIMGVLSLISFNVVDNPLGMLLVNQHLYFVPTFGAVLGNVVFILFISVFTAYWPARRAAKMSAAAALRHFE